LLAISDSQLTSTSSLFPIIAVRLAHLQPSNYQPTIENIVMTNILIQMALQWSLVSECLTCLKPFLQTWHESVPADSNTSQYRGSLSNMLSNSGTKGRSGVDNSFTRASVITKHNRATIGDEDRDGALKLRADHSGFTAKVVSQEKQAWTPEGEADDSIELLLTSRIRVKTTTIMTSS
jgi:hypothetical protein